MRYNFPLFIQIAMALVCVRVLDADKLFPSYDTFHSKNKKRREKNKAIVILFGCVLFA